MPKRKDRDAAPTRTSARKPAKKRRQETPEPESPVLEGESESGSEVVAQDPDEDGIEARRDDADDVDKLTAELRGETRDAVDRIEMRTFLKIWGFLNRWHATAALNLVDETLEWIDNEGANASLEEMHTKWRAINYEIGQSWEGHEDGWKRLLHGTHRFYEVRPRRLLRDIASDLEKVLSLTPEVEEPHEPDEPVETVETVEPDESAAGVGEGSSPSAEALGRRTRRKGRK